MELVTAALRTIAWNDKQVLVACSGGVDSMTLLHALQAIGVKPTILHINYGLRGAESDADEALVRETAAKMGLELRVVACPPERTRGAGLNLQAAARAFRRECYAEWTAQSPQHIVALAQHRDDQVETFFLQLFRGSGMYGLGGMHLERDQLVRPLLDLPKAVLIRYAQENKVAWREDSSNATPAYLRNVFRNELLPALMAENPALTDSCLLLMAHFRQLQEELALTVAPLQQAWETENTLLLEDWNALSPEQKVAFVQAIGFPFWTLERFEQLTTAPAGKRFAFGQWHILRKPDRLEALLAETDEKGWDFKIEEIGILPNVFDKTAVYLDPAKLSGPLQLREWQVGDRIKSVGLKGSQLVSDVLKDAGVPATGRKRLPLLTDGAEVIWIPGIKVGRTALAAATASVIWKVTLTD